ncbi:hypothetical protein DACRYDRAFT_84718 [Dacryopinax primogenitus]|uniref:holo-[acyl-carrier-protein] synthase n=1 Tax=Dacryopinax primogenitus (strain DJM 731) TaxID=1858805 RepID=M5FQG1_DACPD|nr:uncharacterized protein DACRYDRAFT_84718 [Dacryopinax primogenitus]EJT97688.1 hypothetical protein DACRYDRAFT_84718 [Dacryopinax primogenitus]
MATSQSNIQVIVLPWFPQDSLFDPALRLLDENVRASVTRFYRKEGRWRSLLGRLLTVLVLRDQGAEGELQFEKTSRGKPYLAHPVLHPPILFNISHDNSLIAFGYSRPLGDGPHRIGVDCMKLAIRSDETPRMFVQVISEQLTPGELASLQQPMSDEHLIERAFIIWTIKEAFIKAIGEGMAFDLQQIDCRLDQGAIWVSGMPATEWQFRLWAIEIVPAGMARQRYAVTTCEWVGEGGGVIFENGSSDRLELMLGTDLLRRVGLVSAESEAEMQVTFGALHWLA